ncbi:MAG: hypothetical protein R6U70_10785 [Bacillota bacterium]
MRFLGVLYIQLDGLYAGLERKRRPDLRERPLLVVSEGRVVDFCARAAKHPVKRGMPLAHAKNSVIGSFVLQLDASSYGPQLELLPRLAYAVTPQVEVAAPDRVFLQLTPGEDPRAALHSVVRGIPPGCGHRLLAGHGPNKLLARMCVLALQDDRSAGELLFPGEEMEARLLRVQPGEEGAFLRDLPVSFLWTLSGEVIARLQRLGLNTIGEVAEIGEDLLGRHFGAIRGRIVSRNARGEDSTPVASDYPPPRVVWDRSVELSSPQVVRELLTRASHHLARGLTDLGSGGLILGLSLLKDDGRWLSGRRCFSRPVRRQLSLNAALDVLWEEMAKEAGDSTRIRAEISGLVRERATQERLFDRRNLGRREDVLDLLEDLNRKYSGGTLFWGEHFPVSYREKRLSLWDPVRGKGDGNGTSDGGEN